MNRSNILDQIHMGFVGETSAILWVDAHSTFFLLGEIILFFYPATVVFLFKVSTKYVTQIKFMFLVYVLLNAATVLYLRISIWKLV